MKEEHKKIQRKGLAKVKKGIVKTGILVLEVAGCKCPEKSLRREQQYGTPEVSCPAQGSLHQQTPSSGKRLGSPVKFGHPQPLAVPLRAVWRAPHLLPAVPTQPPAMSALFSAWSMQ